MAITDEEFVSLTTFRADGSPRPTPVWITAGAEPGTAVFTTDPASYKVRRIAADPRVTLQACDARGAVRDGSPVVSGTAVVHVEDEVAADVQRRIRDEYGLQATLIGGAQSLMRRLRREEPRPTAGVVITLDEH